MRAIDTLDLQADLKVKLENGIFQLILVNHLVADYTINEAANDAYLRAFCTKKVDSLVSGISSAPAFFVGRDMCQVINHSAAVLDSSDVADEGYPPSKSGFVYFEEGFEVQDVRGETLKLSAIVWQQTADGVILHLWNDQYAHPDDMSDALKDMPEAFRRLCGRWGYVGVSFYRHGDVLGDAVYMPSEKLAEKYETKGVEVQPVTNIVRFAHAFWLMLQQKITVSHKETADKRMARRMSWAGMPSDITVITLRHIEYPEGTGESLVVWKHRWIVRGFWRWQPYKDEAGAWARRRIWIDPYIKGPKDAPLKISRKVNALVR